MALAHDESESTQNNYHLIRLPTLLIKPKAAQEDGKALTHSKAVWQPPLFRAM